MKWMIKVTIGMLLMAVLFVSLSMAIMRANEYSAPPAKIDIQKNIQKITSVKEEKKTPIEEKIKLKQ